jgi:hypothetical protein
MAGIVMRRYGPANAASENGPVPQRAYASSPASRPTTSSTSRYAKCAASLPPRYALFDRGVAARIAPTPLLRSRRTVPATR